MKKACIIDSFCGCMLNSFDSQLFARFFELNGYEMVNDHEDADVVLVNTCAFVKKVEDKVVEKIKELQKNLNDKKNKRSNQKIIVTGCFPKINEKRLNEIFEGDYFGPREKSKINQILNAKNKIENIDIIKIEEQYCNGAPSDRCYIKISDGCLGNCSFCSIKKAKGALKSRPEQEILNEFEEGIKQGFKEFVLLGDDIGCYGKDIKTNIASLLNKLTGIKGDYKIYLHFFEPNWFVEQFDDLLDIFKSKKIALLNIPIQSGNDIILKLMRRPYKINGVMEKVKVLKDKFPDVIIQTHILFGFPGEKEEDFNDSLKAAAEFDVARFFCYSERPDIDALKLNANVSEKEKKARAEKIKNIAKEQGKNYIITAAVCKKS